VFLLPILALLPLGAVNVLFLDHSGELMAGRDVAAFQQEEPALYGSALHDAVYQYKLALLAERTPEVVVIGSSRVLGMNQSMFLVPFANLGRTVNYPAEAEKLAADLISTHKPGLVLFGLDPWWLNPRWTHAPDFRAHEKPGGTLSPAAIFAPMRWLADGRIDGALYGERLLDADPVLRDGVALLGLQAIIDGRGYRPDGSLFRGALVYGGRGADVAFADTLSRIAGDQAQFRFGDAIDQTRVEELRKTIAMLQDAGIAVVTYMPPVAPTVWAAMDVQPDRFAYLAAAREVFATLGAPHLDAWDNATLAFDDCEFFDGFHHGETIDLRLLLALSEAGLLDTDSQVLVPDLETRLGAAAGTALENTDYAPAGQVPLDFLGQGCGDPG
jgi:hypothetical protein